MKKLNYLLLGCAVGIVAGIACIDQAFPSPDPSIWRAYAEATGWWPSMSVTPVLWRRLVSLGLSPGLISAFFTALLAFAVFDILWRMLALLVCPQNECRNWWRLTVPIITFLGTVLAVFSEPVWRLALSGSSALPSLALFLLSCDLFLLSFFQGVVFDDDGNPVNPLEAGAGIYAAILLAGALAVEMPILLALPFAFVAVQRFLSAQIMDGRYREHPVCFGVFVPIRFSCWIAFFIWILGVAAVFAVSGLRQDGGLMRYLSEVVHGALGAASPLGWFLWLGCTVVPFALVCGLLPVLTARDRPLSFPLGVIALLVGSASLAAVSPAARGDWAFVPFAVVHAPFMQALGAVLSAQTAAFALALFAYHAFHVMPRNYTPRIFVTFCVVIAMALMLAVAGRGIGRGQSRQVRQAIVDAMEETVREAKGLSCIFTDGSADVGVELTARRFRQDLCALPLITGGPFAAATNSATLLRDWLREGSPKLKASAVQVGFDLWKRERKPAPAASGLLAREDWPEGARERGVAYAEELGARMAELSRTGALSREPDPRVRDVFAAILWRLSCMARQRGDDERADGLDGANDVVRNLKERIQRERMAAFAQFTDSEGLQLSLQRADFVTARRYAVAVLKRQPDDLSANFGMGMSFLTEGKPKEAIFYLEKAHAAQPTEPAILNNLAIACLQSGNLPQAEEWAKKALERAPDVPEVKDTVRQIEEAKKK